ASRPNRFQAAGDRAAYRSEINKTGSLRRVTMNADIERTTVRKVSLRLLPLLFISYFVCYLDRINVGFAALTMNKDLGFTATIYALGASAFFWGYCLFEIPSNLVLEKIGARIWIARIMISWGLFSGATAFVTSSTSFATIRFFMGVCEDSSR